MPPLSQLDRGQLFGAFYGDRPPKIIGLHGWGRSHKDFNLAFSGMAALAVDLPGFGASPPPSDAWGSAEYAAFLAETLSSMGERFAVVGHSFGGRIAVRLAQLHPDLVSSLVLTGTPLLRLGDAPRSPVGYRFVKKLARLGLISEERLDRARRRYGSADYRSSNGVMRDVLVRVVNEEYGTVLEQIRCHVTLVWGSEDTVVPIEIASRARAILSSAALMVLEGADHYSVLERHEFREAIEEAEERIESPRTQR